MRRLTLGAFHYLTTGRRKRRLTLGHFDYWSGKPVRVGSKGLIQLQTLTENGQQLLTVEFWAEGAWIEASKSKQRLIFFDPNAIVIRAQKGEYLWHKEVRHFAQLMCGGQDLLTMHARELAATTGRMEKVEIEEEFTENPESEEKWESEGDMCGDIPGFVQ